MPMHARRVLAYLSLHKMTERNCDRHAVAERLWSDSPPDRSWANLRTAIWRIRRASPDLLAVDDQRVSVADSVRVDVHLFRAYSERVLNGSIEWTPSDHTLLYGTADVLTGWDEDWLVLFREQIRLLRLHAIEAGARRLCERGLYAHAIDAILPVVTEEPLRESAYAVLIGAHLSVGNVAEARRQFEVFAGELWRALRLRPSAELTAKVQTVAGESDMTRR